MRRFARVFAAIAAIVAVGASGPASVLAVVPSNDAYKNATSIAALPYTQAIDLTDASDDPGYPSCEAASHRRIWYTFTPPANEAVRVSVGGDQTAELALWKVVNGGPKGIELDSCAVDGRDLVARLTGGTKYAISVGQWVTAPPMIATLTIAVQPPPANDDFAQATDITGTSFRADVDEGAAAAASVQAGEPTPSCLAGSSVTSTVWYRLSASQAERVTFGIHYISSLGVYRGTALGSLTEIACANQDDQGTFDADAGATYYFQVIPSTSRATAFTVDLLTPPANDSFSNATPLGALPAQLAPDLTIATVESGEPIPSCVQSRGQTAWWSFTPSATGTLTGSLGTPSGFWAAYSGTSLDALTEIACGGYFSTTPIHVDGGQTLFIQVGFTDPQSGFVNVDLSFQASPGNDDFTDAVPIALGDTVAADLSGATVQAGEANPPACANWPGGSVWYDYVGTGDSVSFGLIPGSTYFAIAAYAGSDLASLTSLGCRLFDGPPLTIKPDAGQTVHLQLWSYDYCCGKTTSLSVSSPGAPVPAFATSISDPSTLDNVMFVDQTQDPGGNPITSWSWDFGDGSTSSDQYAVHRFAADGTYSVRLAVVTSDGRTASASQSVTVRTHDVGIAKFSVPSTAKSGQAKQVTVGVGNRRYPETVSVQLLVSRSNGIWEEVGVISHNVPVLGAGQTVDFQFTYTFTKADAAAGKVTFRAIATLTSARDALPADNEAISLATKVSR